MIKNPSVSICIITYNHVRFIEKSIKSVLLQKTDFDWELIIADDFSNDGTREILYKYKKEHPNKINLIIRDKHVGPCKNFEELILSAKNDYIAYLEGDDYWHDKLKIQNQVSFMQKSPECAMSFTSAIVNNLKTKTKKYRNRYNVNKKFTFKKVLFLGGGFYPSSSLVYKTKLMQNNIKFISSHSTGDYSLALVASHYGTINYLNFCSTTYNVHDKSMTNSDYDKAYILKKYYNDMNLNIKFAHKCYQKFKLTNSMKKKLEFREKYLFVRRIYLKIGFIESLKKINLIIDSPYYLFRFFLATIKK